MTEKKFPTTRAELITPASALNILTEALDNPRPATALRICVIPADSTMGPSPTTGVRAIVEGIDWDNGTVLISPEQPLTVLSAGAGAGHSKINAPGLQLAHLSTP